MSDDYWPSVNIFTLDDERLAKFRLGLKADAKNFPDEESQEFINRLLVRIEEELAYRQRGLL